MNDDNHEPTITTSRVVRITDMTDASPDDIGDTDESPASQDANARHTNGNGDGAAVAPKGKSPNGHLPRCQCIECNRNRRIAAGDVPPEPPKFTGSAWMGHSSKRKRVPSIPPDIAALISDNDTKSPHFSTDAPDLFCIRPCKHCGTYKGVSYLFTLFEAYQLIPFTSKNSLEVFLSRNAALLGPPIYRYYGYTTIRLLTHDDIFRIRRTLLNRTRSRDPFWSVASQATEQDLQDFLHDDSTSQTTPQSNANGTKTCADSRSERSSKP